MSADKYRVLSGLGVPAWMQELDRRRAPKVAMYDRDQKTAAIHGLVSVADHVHDYPGGRLYAYLSAPAGVPTISLDSVSADDPGCGWFTTKVLPDLQALAKQGVQVVVVRIISYQFAQLLARLGFTPVGDGTDMQLIAPAEQTTLTNDTTMV